MTKLRVAVIMGGTNTEHEVSLMSAKSILDNLDTTKYTLIPITITPNNIWLDQNNHKLNPYDLVSICDIVFPVLHGPYGEDGTIQGLFELMRLPYVGCGVTASAICMDKIIQKDLCQAYQIPQVDYLALHSFDWQTKQAEAIQSIETKFGDHYPLFVKPASQGSSIGVGKVKSASDLVPAIQKAFTLDHKLIIEHGIDHAREIECSVLGDNQHPEASILGEIIPHADFYDYDTKYFNNNSEAVIPAKLSTELTKQIRSIAKLTYRVLGCDGLSRIDFLLDPITNQYYLNEPNTMPGFTTMSMYPKLWEVSGLNYSDLLDRLIDLALTRHHSRSLLNTSLASAR